MGPTAELGRAPLALPRAGYAIHGAKAGWLGRRDRTWFRTPEDRQALARDPLTFITEANPNFPVAMEGGDLNRPLRGKDVASEGLFTRRGPRREPGPSGTAGSREERVRNGRVPEPGCAHRGEGGPGRRDADKRLRGQQRQPPPHRRRRGDATEQIGWMPQDREIAHRSGPVGVGDSQLGQHVAPVMPPAPLFQRGQRLGQPPGQPAAVGQLAQHPGSPMGHDPVGPRPDLHARKDCGMRP
jgi:hypothetical protein